MTCWTGFCIDQKSNELKSIMRKASKNREKKDSKLQLKCSKLVLRIGGEIDLLGQESLIKLSCKILLTKSKYCYQINCYKIKL